ncbi:ABC-F family ATP-binding cassette domain-containing protein [Pelagibacterium halotolerans]|uniref:ABC-F family ATP-binding cassette domain-containing protein n=1 Tax=Pelagibacterium halotolerans TaxID=531813 RepID=UPI00089CC600|nr:ATP-binding cassette domain-containing protein [Pelagibacterium halotolerans]QJR18153.1 ATP-binding cassette domain-containing protein [Pelagibacterium halotolerans]SDZ82841.1 ATP-binding cassette, subfamily F, uup [Pelagibacterium halotolerans]
MAAPLLALQSIRLVMGSTPLLEGAELSVAPGDKIALVGRNGSGKSTLLKIAAGTIEPDGGERFFQPGATVRYLPQEPDLSGYPTTLAYVEEGLEGADDPYRAQYLLEQLGLTGSENPTSLSGGEARRAALARVLAPEPDILLLDEPTNHLDLPVIEWLEGELKSLRSALVLISHDRRFLSDLTRSTVWIDRGQTRRIDQGFGAFEAWRDDFLEQEEKEQHKLARKIAAEEHWVRYGVTARRKRNVRRMDLLSGLRQQVRDYRGPQGTVKMTVAEGRSSGAMVVEAENISKAFGDRVVVEDFSTRIMRGSRVGIVGPNGAGKTTLIRMLTGDLESDSGTVRLGTRLELAVLDQRRASLDPEATLKDVLTGGGSDTLTINGQPKHVIGYMKEFLFTPEQARTAVGKLSGGERNRVTLARALALPSNVLVLDEPTNDLDLETLDLLEEMIADYQGTVIVVSHDRDFLDKVATSIIVAEGDGSWNEYAGGYSDMVAQRGAGVSARRVEKTAPAAKSKPAPAAPAHQQRRKLSFKDKHALETLPGEMDGVREKMAALQTALDDPGLYNRDPNKFEKVTADLATAQQNLVEMEDRWLELEMLREDLEG